MLTEFHIGIDDTDSQSRGCTTYTAAVLFQELTARRIQASDFPWLVRLNPNIPWKTRGNGATSIHLLVDEAQIETIQHLALQITENTADMSANGTDPAMVFLKGSVTESLRDFSSSALHEVLTVHQAQALATKLCAECHLLKGTRGLIGAMAAIGAELDSLDHTFEIIAYRTKENLGTPRLVDEESIRAMNSKYDGRTFHNVDPESGRILVCPHGPDPVLIGITGRTPKDVKDAFGEVQVNEPIERITIFKTNQGTDAHLRQVKRVVDLSPHQSAVLQGRVETVPRVLRGGHVVFRLSDDTGTVDCAAFAPTKSLARVTRDLLPGDRIRAYGGIRKHRAGTLTLNLEKIHVLDLIDKVYFQNPLCASCGARCESMGLGQDFRCRKCNTRIHKSGVIKTSTIRNLQRVVYTAAVGARRHLSSPDDQRAD